jgi:hypothetical protein
MQLTISPENPLEWLALQANLAPIPLLHAQIMPVLAKAVLEAADKGVFDAAKNGPQTLDELVHTLQLNRKALGELMGLLTAMGYFTYRNDRFQLTRMARRFALKDDPQSVHGMMVFNNRVMWDWLSQLGTYLETGQGIQFTIRFLPAVALLPGGNGGGCQYRSRRIWPTCASSQIGPVRCTFANARHWRFARAALGGAL